MELEFPIEFLAHGTPVSSQSQNPLAKTGWKDRVKTASVGVIPPPHFASEERMAVTLFYLPDARMQGDVDNIVKLTIDALKAHIYIDDGQVERVLVQKFEPGNIFNFSNPTPAFVQVRLSRAVVGSGFSGEAVARPIKQSLGTGLSCP
jgi:crossover junction endodeoxyribonuclease RusA